MVIGEKFAWGHIPKTGGDATRAFFKTITELKLQFGPIDSKKHRNFVQAGVTNKILALNIRRLPSLILSRVFELNAGHGVPLPNFKDIIKPHYRLPEQFKAQHYNLGDSWIKNYTDRGRLDIKYWLRCEHLVDDFIGFITHFTPINKSALAKRLEKCKTKRKRKYNHNIHDYWSSADIVQIYNNNPLWATIEEKVYGTLL